MTDHDRETYRAADWRYLDWLADNERWAGKVVIVLAAAFVGWLVWAYG
jgi:hypothetical protein